MNETTGQTVGRSKIDPRKYKGDSLVQAWVDRRELATISLWLDQSEMYPRTISDLLKLTISAVVTILVDNGVVEKVKLTGDADRIMRKYKANLNPSGRGLKNLTHNLVLDDRVGAKFEGSDSLIERVKRQTNDDVERLEKIDRRLDDVERQRNVALNDPRVVSVDVKKNVEKMKQSDDRIKEM